MSQSQRLLFASFLALVGASPSRLTKSVNFITIPESAPPSAGIPLNSFVSYSFELSSIPDYAGNFTNPNNYSYNLMLNIGRLSGSNPIARIGGNTQDIAIFNESQDLGLVGTYNTTISSDYPAEFTIGPAFFESYQTWPGVSFSHGFNLRNNDTSVREAQLASVPYVCNAIRDHQNGMYLWEMGNEPDLYTVQSSRSADWDEQDYVDQWLNATRTLKAAIKAACPDLADAKWLTPSFAGTTRQSIFALDPIPAWEDGLDADKDIGVISSHNYMGVSTDLGVTLQGTLMNHSNVVAIAAKQLNESRLLAALPNDTNPGLPFILGEHNSLARQGRPGLSNTFGAALWGVDWNLYIASNNISRSHMHQGTNYRYQSWQPIETNITTKGTKAPYYGQAAVAAILQKPNPQSLLQVTPLPQNSSFDAGYAVHIDNHLTRIAFINLREYNATSWNTNYTSTYPRPSNEFSFKLPVACSGGATVQRLMANGSDALTGITWDGYSYNHDLDNGNPVRLTNVTRGECVTVKKDGSVGLSVPWSSVAVLSLAC